MKRAAIIINHWYQGKTGKPRRLDARYGDGLMVYWQDGEIFNSECNIESFQRWAVKDLGPDKEAP